MFTRNHLVHIQELLLDFPAVALTGPRQIGKTTLARQLQSMFPDSLYLDLEDRDDLQSLVDPKILLSAYSDNLVIIDEVQVLPELFTALRPLIDKHRHPGRFLLLGSISPQLVKGVSETLTGRIVYTELPPLLITELKGLKLEQNDLWIRGGFPDALISRSDRSSLNWKEAFIQSYVQRELAAMFHTNLSPTIIRNFWQMLAHYHGGIWNAQSFSNSLSISNPTVKRYQEYLEGAYLLRILSPWHVNVSKRVVKSPKVYIRDSGLLHTMLRINSLKDLLGHPVAGSSWEGFAIEQIINCAPKGLDFYFYRTQNGAEADLVIVKGIEVVAALEIKLSNAPVPSKGFYQSLEDLKLERGYIITPSAKSQKQSTYDIHSLLNFIEKILPKFK